MKKTLLLLSLSLVFFLPGCGGGGSAPTCSNTFTAGTTVRIYYTHPVYPTTIILERIAPANGVITVPTYGYPCSSLVWIIVTNSNATLAASPSSIYLPSPPSTATVTGTGFDATYGMPMVEYFDGNGYLVGSVYATSLSGSTSLQANVPDLSDAYSGTYQVRVTNKTSAGYYSNRVGTVNITAWGRDRLDSDGDGWYDDEDCDPWDPYLTNNCGGEVCGGGQEPIYVCP
jgi:hypothetical protein